MSEKKKHKLSNFDRSIYSKQDAICEICGPTKAFPYKDKRLGKGFNFRCSISNSKRAIKDRARRLEDKDYYEKWKASNTANAAKRREGWTLEKKSKVKMQFRKSIYTTVYNRTWEEILAMAESQNNQCLICRVDFEDWNWNVDHDHSCCNQRNTCGNCIRGLLCSLCNSGLGFFKDNVKNMINAVLYLEANKHVDFDQYYVRKVNRKPMSFKHSKIPKTHMMHKVGEK